MGFSSRKVKLARAKRILPARNRPPARANPNFAAQSEIWLRKAHFRRAKPSTTPPKVKIVRAKRILAAQSGIGPT
jgi:hypothetical protein